jgi:hypothetical protein
VDLRGSAVCLSVALVGGAFIAPNAAASADPAGGFRTLLPLPSTIAVHAALAGAARRLETPACRRVLTGYRDRSGRTLARVLEERATTAAAHLRLIVFADGVGQAPCRNPDVVASTMPGSRVVYVCPARFEMLQGLNPARAEAVLIHELLHSLGLAEDAPTSRALTDRVQELCGR